MVGKVWAVSSGSYSDYRVEAVFTTEALAVEYADRSNRKAGSGYDPYEVEEFALDPTVTLTSRWRVDVTGQDMAAPTYSDPYETVVESYYNPPRWRRDLWTQEWGWAGHADAATAEAATRAAYDAVSEARAGQAGVL